MPNESIEVSLKELREHPTDVFERAGSADIVALNSDGSVRMIIVRTMEPLDDTK